MTKVTRKKRKKLEIRRGKSNNCEGLCQLCKTIEELGEYNDIKVRSVMNSMVELNGCIDC